MRFSIQHLVASLAVVALLASCDDSSKKKAEDNAKMQADSIARADSMAKMAAEEAAKPKDIVTIASTSATTLAAAVTAGELVETLKGAGPFTVFAPTNEAFASVQKDVDMLLKPENKAKLQKVLKYHVVAGKVMAADLKDGQEVTTVEGGKLRVTVKDGKVTVGGAEVTTADVPASNGVIHIINKVLMPK